MGGVKKKRKVRRHNDKKFVFEWDDSEDTSKDINPLYNERKEISLFGKKRQNGDGLLQETSSQLHVSQKDKWIDRHWTEKPLSEMRDRDWRIFKEDFNISTKGGSIPSPLRFWHEAEIPAEIKEVIRLVGYTEPTPIQRQSIPIALQNRDLIGIAETGKSTWLVIYI